jgi:hypothetical protein
MPIRHQHPAQRMGSNGQRGPTRLQFGEPQSFLEKAKFQSKRPSIDVLRTALSWLRRPVAEGFTET